MTVFPESQAPFHLFLTNFVAGSDYGAPRTTKPDIQNLRWVWKLLGFLSQMVVLRIVPFPLLFTAVPPLTAEYEILTLKQ